MFHGFLRGDSLTNNVTLSHPQCRSALLLAAKRSDRAARNLRLRRRRDGAGEDSSKVLKVRGFSMPSCQGKTGNSGQCNEVHKVTVSNGYRL